VITFFVNVLKTQKEGFIQSVSAKVPDIIIIKTFVLSKEALWDSFL
jgi:hypothetical protein